MLRRETRTLQCSMSEVEVVQQQQHCDSLHDTHGFLIRCEEEDRCQGCCFEEGIQNVSKEEGSADIWEKVLLEEKNPSQIRKLIKKGVPKVLRGEVWKWLLDVRSVSDGLTQEEFSYELKVKEVYHHLTSIGLHLKGQDLLNLAEQIDDKMLMALKCKGKENCGEELAGEEMKNEEDEQLMKLARQIIMDVDRTFPTHNLFITGSKHQVLLFQLLMVYARYNKAIGYCQGMAYVAALLLMYMGEEDAFMCFYALNESRIHLNMFYDQSLHRVKCFAEAIHILLKEHFPKMASHLDDLGVYPLMFATPWLMGLYTGIHCWDTVLLITDLFFLEGNHVFLNAALALLEVCQPEVMAFDRLDQVLPFLQNIPTRLVHYRSLRSLLYGKVALKSVEEVEEYEQAAEEEVLMEEEKQKQLREQYFKRSVTSSVSRKRRIDECEDNTVTDAPNGLLARFFSVFTPAKKQRIAPGVEKMVDTATAPDEPRTPLSNMGPPRVFVGQDVLVSAKKQKAELYYTPQTGLVYTSPNTIEMRDITTLSGRSSQRRRSLRRRKLRKETGLLGKLQYESPRQPHIRDEASDKDSSDIPNETGEQLKDEVDVNITSHIPLLHLPT